MMCPNDPKKSANPTDPTIDLNPHAAAPGAAESEVAESEVETIGPIHQSAFMDTMAPMVTGPSDGGKSPDDTNVTIDFSLDALAGGVSGSTGKQTRPKVIGGYEILKVLGRGGMGIVYQAKQKKLDRIVALKMVLAGSHASSEQLMRFISEAKAVGHLQHPSIVQIFDVGEHDNLPFFSLEFVDGDSLDRRLDGKPLAPIEAAKLLEILCRAMQYAHDHGILHRDLKPANVLLTKAGVPKITDFGLAKRLEDADDSSSTRTGTIMGTPSYMSPEQASGDVRQMGPATDQYSLGAMLYEFLTGRPPFLAAKPIETVLKVLGEEPVPPRQLQSTLPIDIETICLKAIQKEPGKRYSSCSALADDLGRFVRGEPILARPIGRPEQAWRWCRRNPVLASLIATAATCILAVAIISTWSALMFSRKNEELANTNTTLNEVNDTLKSTNADLQESNQEKQRRSERLQQYVQDVFTQTSRLNIQESPKAKDYKNEILTKSLPLVDEIRHELPKGGPAEATMMSVLQQLGNSYADQGKTADAEKARSMLVEMARGRVIIQAGSDKSRQNLVNSLNGLSSTRMELNRDLDSSLALLNESLAISQSIVDEPKAVESTGLGKNPMYLSKWVLANTQIALGTMLYRKGNSAAALPHYERASELYLQILPTLVDGSAYENLPPSTEKLSDAQWNQKKQRELLELRDNIRTSALAKAAVLLRTNQLKEAEEQFQVALDKASNELKTAPENAPALRNAIGLLGNWGEFLAQTNRVESALEAFRKAADYSDKMLKMNNESADLNRGAAVAYHRLAQWLAKDDPTKSNEYGVKALEIRQAMVTNEPSNDRRQIEMMVAASRFGEISTAKSIADRYLTAEHKDSEMLLEIAQALAQCSARSKGDVKMNFELQAISAIQSAIKFGFRDEFVLKNDIDLEPLRTLPEFEQVLEELRGK